MASGSSSVQVDRKADASPLLDIRRRVEDLMPHRPAVYWLDMLASAGIGWGAFWLAGTTPSWDAARIALLVVAGFAFLRAALFIHELSHFRRGVLSGFTTVWNLLVGVPLALPSFMYVGTHLDHHKRKLYGTIRDPEYLPLALMPRWRSVVFVVEMLVVPVLMLLRFGVISPLSWILPPLRRVTIERMSSLVINPAYRRRTPKSEDMREWIILELVLFAAIMAAVAGLASGRLSIHWAVQWYVVATLVAFINQVRTLAAHLYANDGAEVDTVAQLLDSVNVRGVPVLTDLVFPVGLKYHALHHLLPDMPYHALPAAHRRLMSELPDEAPYRRAEHAGFFSVTQRLFAAVRPRGGPKNWKASDDPT